MAEPGACRHPGHQRVASRIPNGVPGRPLHRLAVGGCAAFLITAVWCSGSMAQPPPAGKLTLTSSPRLFPDFSRRIHDYVVRCGDRPVRVNGHVASGWEARTDGYRFRSRDFTWTTPMAAGKSLTITARRVNGSRRYRYFVRCLPRQFPTYSFTRYGRVTPKLFAVDTLFSTAAPFAIVLDGHGVPVWWYDAPVHAPRVLPDGHVIWASWYDSPPGWKMYSLEGARLRDLNGVGWAGNGHDLQPLRNGAYLLGGYVPQQHRDTSAYGGSPDAAVVNAELQQVNAAGDLVWDWKSQDHISLAETPDRHWRSIVKHQNAYDILHWNSIEPDGKAVIASFRNLDAVYKIRKRTGGIVWKLGGTHTAKSLTVRQDPHRYPLGAPHDARLLADGTLTVFDNRSGLSNRMPRAVRYRINQKKRTATVVGSVTDPHVRISDCCGSARRFANGDWLIDWGNRSGIGGYEPDGQRTFFMRFDKGFSYRAEPVPRAVSKQDLRDGMDAMYGGSS
jgi:Arylsulfotransferase (ASST)